MGRQTRQARRAQERRQTQRARHVQRQGPSWSLVLGGAVILAAILIFAGFAFLGGKSNSGSPNGTITIPPGKPINGIGCDGGMTTAGPHIHAQLGIYYRGKPFQINSNFGHDTNHDCLFWMHSHVDANGIIHMESPHVIHPTIATWLAIAKETIPPAPNLAPKKGETEEVWRNLKRYYGNPLNIKLYNHTQVDIEFGPPFVTPQKFNFAKYQL